MLKKIIFKNYLLKMDSLELYLKSFDPLIAASYGTRAEAKRFDLIEASKIRERVKNLVIQKDK